MWPTFTVTEICADGAPLGTIDIFAVGEDIWVGDRFVGYLQRATSLICGRWYSNGGDWRFVPVRHSTFDFGETFPVFDSYWGERVLIATDLKRDWAQATWTDVDDHDHCAICWSTISTEVSIHYFKSSESDSVCADCYEQHVSHQDISFVPTG